MLLQRFLPGWIASSDSRLFSALSFRKVEQITAKNPRFDTENEQELASDVNSVLHLDVTP